MECLADLCGCVMAGGVWKVFVEVWVVSIDWTLGAGGEGGWGNACRPNRAVGGVDGVQFWFAGVGWMKCS